MLRIAVNVDDKREFYLLTSNPDAISLPVGTEFEIDEVDGEIAERLRAHHPQAWRQDPELKIVDLTGEINLEQPIESRAKQLAEPGHTTIEIIRIDGQDCLVEWTVLKYGFVFRGWVYGHMKDPSTKDISWYGKLENGKWHPIVR